jgi:hypothetical protein
MSNDNSYNEGIAESEIKSLVYFLEDTISEYRQVIEGVASTPEKFEARYKSNGTVEVTGDINGKTFRYPVDNTRAIAPDLFHQFRQLHNGVWKDYALVSQSKDMISVLDLETGEIVSRVVADGDVIDFHSDRLIDIKEIFKTSEELDSLSKLAVEAAPKGSSFKSWFTAPAFKVGIESELAALHRDLYRASGRLGNTAFFSFYTGPKTPAGVVAGKRRFLGKLDLSRINRGEMKIVDLQTIELDVYGPRVSDLISPSENPNEGYIIHEKTTRLI